MKLQLFEQGTLVKTATLDTNATMLRVRHFIARKRPNLTVDQINLRTMETMRRINNGDIIDIEFPNIKVRISK